ncbi:MAG: hypothetical protein NNA20_04745 [Nitrospira sp.]|nr:hypothetical protein [Nitrospira sp.]MCP9441880.1 hypothetical protein [Nitrospira sp.]
MVKRSKNRSWDQYGAQSGLCLTEVMIGMAAALVVLAACLEVLYLGQKAVWTNTRRIADQQDLRLGLEVFEQEVRLATTPALLTIQESIIEFFANIHGKRTTITAAVSRGQSVLPVVDGIGWERGKFVKLCQAGVCETRRLARDGQRNQLTVENPVDTDYPAGASVEMHNRVTYYTRVSGETVRLMRMVDGGAGVLIGDLKAVRFSYWDRRGRRTNDPSAVTRVLVEIEPSYSWRIERRAVALRS